MESDMAKQRNSYQKEIDAVIRRAEIAERNAVEKEVVIERLTNLTARPIHNDTGFHQERNSSVIVSLATILTPLP